MGSCKSKPLGQVRNSKVTGKPIDLEALSRVLTDKQQKFFDAIKHSDVEAMRDMLSQKPNLLKARMKWNVSPVMYAAKFSELEVLMILAEQFKCDLWELDDSQGVGCFNYACIHELDSIENVAYL